MTDTQRNGDTCSRTDRAYQAIARWISEGHVDSGSPLMENELAMRLQMSRTPVREALRRLERDGLVEIRPRVGAYVRGMTMKDLQEIFEVREAAEGMLARLAALRGKRETLDQLRRLFNRAGTASPGEERNRLYEEAGDRLHEYIAEGAGNSRLKRILDTLHIQIRRQQSITRELPDSIGISYNEHMSVVDALESGDPALAEEAMRSHIRSARNSVFDAYKNGSLH